MTERRIGRTELSVSELGFGGTALGNMFKSLDDASAFAAVEAAAACGISYYDTAPMYGLGLSEIRLGQAIKPLAREEIIISSKVGRSLTPVDPAEVKPGIWDQPLPMRADIDFSYDGVMRSFEATLTRLDTPFIDMLAIHDPDDNAVSAGLDPYSRSHFKAAMDGAYRALAELRGQGLIKAIGVGITQWQMLCDFAAAGDFDYFLLAGRYTLLDQESLDRLLPLCEERGISLVIGGPYNSGILATGAVAGAVYNYRPATPSILEKVSRIEAVCRRHKVSLQAAALQFPLLHPLVASVIPGARSATEVENNLALVREPIPADFWTDLKSERLLDERAPVSSRATATHAS
ncbi:aldo/keto reductase [Sphingomonas sp. MMS24-J13]|uniref:aldo/keto reductase n=1 Tax=Sphingomonas sp. MMS24-J13 TaxID=3238686 RepID=UPI00384E8A43